MPHLTSSFLPMASLAASAFVNAALTGLVLWLATSLCLKLFPRIAPANRFAVWAAVLLTAISLHFVPFVGRTVEGSASLDTGGLHLDPRWAYLIAATWVLLATVRLVRLVQSAMSVYGIAQRAIPTTSDVFDKALQHERRKSMLCVSDEIDRPSVVGFFRPRVLIPVEVYQKISPAELEQILVHELGHIRRYDDWSNLLQKISLVLFPMNPAIAWIERSLCAEREMACDDCVLSSATASRKQYALCLTNLAEYSLLRRNLSLALGAWGRRSELAVRVEKILNRPKYSLGRRAGFGLTAIIIGGLFTGGVKLSHLPAVVSFSEGATDAATVQPVIERPVSLPVSTEAPASAVLVKAVMPEPSTRFVKTKAHKRNVAKSVRTTRHPDAIVPAALVRTDFRDDISLPRLILTIDQSQTPSYAALPVGNGWLVIQL